MNGYPRGTDSCLNPSDSPPSLSEDVSGMFRQIFSMSCFRRMRSRNHDVGRHVTLIRRRFQSAATDFGAPTAFILNQDQQSSRHRFNASAVPVAMVETPQKLPSSPLECVSRGGDTESGAINGRWCRGPSNPFWLGRKDAVAVPRRCFSPPDRGADPRSGGRCPEVTVTLATWVMDARASPRNPKVRMVERSANVCSLLVGGGRRRGKRRRFNGEGGRGGGTNLRPEDIGRSHGDPEQA